MSVMRRTIRVTPLEGSPTMSKDDTSKDLFDELPENARLHSFGKA